VGDISAINELLREEMKKQVNEVKSKGQRD